MSTTILGVLQRREALFAGGEHTTIKDGDATKDFMINQVYAERLIPKTPSKLYPIVFIAGLGQTGNTFLNTPDGRPGWAEFFLSHGYVVYLTDQCCRGRSLSFPSAEAMQTLGTEQIENYFTATSNHSLWPQSKLHNQWPGTGVFGDPSFNAFFAATVPSLVDRYVSEELNTKAYSALLDRIGPAYLITHSQAGAYGWRIADARPELVKGIVAIEPSGPPFRSRFPFVGPWRRWGITDGPITYAPSAGPDGKEIKTITIPAKDDLHTDCIMQRDSPKVLINLCSVPVLVVTGEASYHQPHDYCTVEYLRQASVQVEFADLGQEGIHGNGHMLFMEKNNLVIAERVLRWFKKHKHNLEL